MRVAILAHSACRHDAVGDQVAHKVQFFQDRGAEVRLFVHTAQRLQPALRPIAQESRGIELETVEWRYLSDCDLVLVEFSQFFPLLDCLPLLAREKPRLGVTYYGVTPPEWAEGPLRQTLEESLGQRGLVWAADAVLTHSRFTTRELVEATSYPEQRIQTFDLPVQDGLLPEPVRTTLAQRLGLKDARILLFVGRLAGNKRPETLIRALAALLSPAAGERGRGEGVHAVFIGEQQDVYAREWRRCQELARELRVADRVHFLGQLGQDDLVDAYRSADLLVIPSRHEGFCLPVREAMACGLPVLAARTTALPETIGDAGLTFTPDDPHDLAAQVNRVLTPVTLPERTGKIALVAFRFGKTIAGGAERSLRRIGDALTRRGYQVEVFTTCNRSESRWSNELPAGSSREDGLIVHRFPIDAHDPDCHRRALAHIETTPGASPTAAQEYVEASIHSAALLTELEKRIHEFEAVIAGPYLFGLTCDVARRFPDKTLILPCFHDEPLARLPLWPKVYGKTGGILYHSPEEQDFAQTELGVNHPNAGLIGTHIPSRRTSAFDSKDRLGKAEGSVFQAEFDPPRPYVVYCGRYSSEKGIDRLLDFAARYEADHPGRCGLVFMGQGEAKIPRAAWLRDLGWVDEQRKAAVLRGAVCLVQLSRRESLSLVVLEAWREGTPVIVDGQAAVLRGQVARSEGGIAVESYEEFAQALDRLLEENVSAALGAQGQAYVEAAYGDEAAFGDRILERIEGLRTPLAQQLRERGLIRAGRSRLAVWRQTFGAWVDQLLHAPRRPFRDEVCLLPGERELVATPDQASLLVPLTVENRGSHPAANRGPGRTLIFSQLVDVESGAAQGPVHQADLPCLITPGQTAPAALVVRIPAQAGHYHLQLWASRAGEQERHSLPQERLFLTVEPAGASASGQAPYLKVARWALAVAQQMQRLPDDYEDVTQGWLARLKRWLKQKLLGNFRRAYVDVLSRQQSQVNQQLVLAVQQLTQCCATLSHALESMQRRLDDGMDVSFSPGSQNRGGPHPTIQVDEAPAHPSACSHETDQLTGRPSA